jgi:ankyrin repeat protein
MTVVKFLVGGAKLNVHERDANGNTALDLAQMHGHDEVVAFLMVGRCIEGGCSCVLACRMPWRLLSTLRSSQGWG